MKLLIIALTVLLFIAIVVAVIVVRRIKAGV